MDQGTFYKSGTAIVNGSAGVNIKFNKLGGRSNCAGTWLTLAVDYSRGNTVNFLNSKIDNSQFWYDQGAPLVPATQPRSTGMGHNHGSGSSSVMPGGCYMNSGCFNAKHELLQFRVGLIFMVGNCK